jgi:bifunctional non-homologous end joining protein LigD
LQAATDHKNTARLVYFAFDLLSSTAKTSPRCRWSSASDACKRCYDARRNIYFLDHVIGNGKAFYAATCKHDAEGIVSKRIDAPYRPGDRGLWRNAKCINEDDFVVVGFTNPEGRRPYLGALLLAYHDPAGRLVYMPPAPAPASNRPSSSG